jgi:glycosyltransferase involved in cell wall biosynthesis
MSNPLVSVVVAVKNGERFLRSALDSVLAQEYHPLEIFVVDGISTDRTVEIARSFEQMHVIHQKSKGVASAWNEGIAAANGEFVAFLSHDDLWMPDKLRLQVTYLINHPEIHYVIARVKFFVEPGSRIPAGFRKELLQQDHVGRIMETLVVRKSLFDTIGTFTPQLSTAEDVDWFARAQDCGFPMAIIPHVLLHKRVHDANISLNLLENNHNLLQALRASIDRKRALK